MTQQIKPNCVVLLSGGLDSTTVLAQASQNYHCYALSFDYNQRHNVELDAAKNIAKKYQVTQHKIVNLGFLGELGGSALTDSTLDVPGYSNDTSNIPITYVPARNTIFIAIALGWAEVLKAKEIFIGASSIDYSGYPDCRPEYFAAYQSLINLATKHTVEDSNNHIKITTPLLNLSKAQTIQLGHSLNVDYRDTVSCYQANQNGHACGQCDSCALRKQGFIAAGVEDQTNYYYNN